MANQVIFLELVISNILMLSITIPVRASHLADDIYARSPQKAQRGTSDCRFNAKARIVLEEKKGIADIPHGTKSIRLQQTPRTLLCGRAGYSHSFSASSALRYSILEYSNTLHNDSVLRLAISLRAHHLERQGHPSLRRRLLRHCCSRPF